MQFTSRCYMCQWR